MSCVNDLPLFLFAMSRSSACFKTFYTPKSLQEHVVKLTL